MEKNYQICTRCIMDTTDPEIQFDENGVCSHCRKFETTAQKFWFPNENGRKQLEAAVQRIKKESAGKKYDCIIGLSGGVDSIFVFYGRHRAMLINYPTEEELAVLFGDGIGANIQTAAAL